MLYSCLFQTVPLEPKLMTFYTRVGRPLVCASLFAVSPVNRDRTAPKGESFAMRRRWGQGDDNERKRAKQLTWRMPGLYYPFKRFYSRGGFWCIFRNGDGLIQTRQFIMDENIWVQTLCRLERENDADLPFGLCLFDPSHLLLLMGPLAQAPWDFYRRHLLFFSLCWPTAGLVSMPAKQMSHQHLLAKWSFGAPQETTCSLMTHCSVKCVSVAGFSADHPSPLKTDLTMTQQQWKPTNPSTGLNQRMLIGLLWMHLHLRCLDDLF